MRMYDNLYIYMYIYIYIYIYECIYMGCGGDATEDVEFWCPRVMKHGANSSR